MKIDEALNSLENSWSRDEVLVKIKNGADSESIVNDFFSNKKDLITSIKYKKVKNAHTHFKLYVSFM